MKTIQFIERDDNIFGEQVEREVTLPIDNISYINITRCKEKGKRKWNENEFYIHTKDGTRWKVDEQTFNTCKEILELDS